MKADFFARRFRRREEEWFDGAEEFFQSGINLNRLRAIQHVGGHEGIMFGEGVRLKTGVAFRCGHKL